MVTIKLKSLGLLPGKNFGLLAGATAQVDPFPRAAAQWRVGLLADTHLRRYAFRAEKYANAVMLHSGLVR